MVGIVHSKFLKLTKVARLFEEGKIEAVNTAVNDTLKGERMRVAKDMIVAGDDILKVMQITKLTRAELDEAQILISA
ncbi:MAG: hypothetical protein FWC89_05495 [Defluviitaleaceae bacterium]|nr:hypothetical protein [Defluviitaleaceae bacterium]